MSALAGPGDLAGSLGEMATEQCHLLSVWAAGMLAGVSLGLETQPLPRLSHWLGDAISRLNHRLHSQDLLFSYRPPPRSPWRRGARKGSLASLGSMLSPGLTMGLKPQDSM